jgi:uroporphyrinogen decarboxylase
MTRRFYVERYEQLAWIKEVPYLPPRPDVSPFLAQRERIGERGLLLAMVPTAASTLQHLLGTEGFALAMMDVPGQVLDLLWAFQARIEDLVRYLLDEGVGPVFGDVGAEVVGPPIMSPRLFRQLYAEPERRTAALLHARGALLHVHCHGSVRPLLEDFASIGVDVLHPVEAPPLGDTPLPVAKAALAGRVCVEGNVQIGDIYERPPAEFRAIAQRTIEEGAPGGGFILCPTASPYTPELPPTALANYLTLLQLGTAFRYES